MMMIAEYFNDRVLFMINNTKDRLRRIIELYLKVFFTDKQLIKYFYLLGLTRNTQKYHMNKTIVYHLKDSSKFEIALER